MKMRRRRTGSFNLSFPYLNSQPICSACLHTPPAAKLSVYFPPFWIKRKLSFTHRRYRSPRYILHTVHNSDAHFNASFGCCVLCNIQYIQSLFSQLFRHKALFCIKDSDQQVIGNSFGISPVSTLFLCEMTYNHPTLTDAIAHQGTRHWLVGCTQLAPAVKQYKIQYISRKLISPMTNIEH